METQKNIKEETIKKYLQVLNTMKLLVDRTAFVNTEDITRKYKINNAFPYIARKLGYFEVNSSGYWSCTKGEFHPIDARKVLNFMYNRYQKKAYKKPTNKRDYSNNIFNETVNRDIVIEREFIPPSEREVKDYCKSKDIDIDIDNWFTYYRKNNWKKSSGEKVTNWKLTINNWFRNQQKPVIYNSKKLSEYSDEEITKEANKRDIFTGMSDDLWLKIFNETSLKEIAKYLKKRGVKGGLRIEEKYEI